MDSRSIWKEINWWVQSRIVLHFFHQRLMVQSILSPSSREHELTDCQCRMSARRAVPLPNVTGHNFLTLSSAAHSKREPQSRPSQSVLYPASLLFFSFSLISQVGTVAVLPHSNCVVNCDLQVWLLGGLLFCAVIKSELRLRFRQISTLYSPKSTPRPDRLTVFS